MKKVLLVAVGVGALAFIGLFIYGMFKSESGWDDDYR